MGEGIKKKLSMLLIAAMLLGGIQIPVLAQDNGVTVYNNNEFMEALSQGKSPITVGPAVTIVNGADADGRMRPVVIPGGTV